MACSLGGFGQQNWPVGLDAVGAGADGWMANGQCCVGQDGDGSRWSEPAL